MTEALDPDYVSLDEQVLISLRQIIRATDLQSRRLGRETGLTTPQLVVLRAIGAQELPTASYIAKSVSLSQATVTTILNRLENKGLIERHRSEKDKRRVNLILTTEGLAVFRSAPKPLQESFLRRFKTLEGWEQHQIVACLERVARMMDASELDAAPMLDSQFTIS